MLSIWTEPKYGTFSASPIWQRILPVLMAVWPHQNTTRLSLFCLSPIRLICNFIIPSSRLTSCSTLARIMVQALRAAAYRVPACLLNRGSFGYVLLTVGSSGLGIWRLPRFPSLPICPIRTGCQPIAIAACVGAVASMRGGAGRDSLRPFVASAGLPPLPCSALVMVM